MMMKRVSLFGCVIMVAAIVAARADVVHLTGGGHLTGSVTGFDGAAFQVQRSNGTTNFVADSVQGVDFEHGYVTADLKTKAGNSATGKLWLFDKQKFNLEGAGGESRRISVGEVAEAKFTYTPEPVKPRPTPPPVTTKSAKVARPAAPDIEVITHGQSVDIRRHLVDGKVTLVEFYADWCGPCRVLAPILENIASEDSDVAVRKVDIIRWSSDVSRQYALNSIPRVQVYDGAGRLLRTLSGFHEDDLRDAVEQAKSSTHR